MMAILKNTSRKVLAPLLLIVAAGCGGEGIDEQMENDVSSTGDRSSALYGTATGNIVVANYTSTSMSRTSINYNGYFSPFPVSSIPSGYGNFFTHYGSGNILSGHFDYSAGSKSCRFDYSSYPQTYNGPCVFNRSARSTGSTYATCTATITAYDFNTCGMSVTLSMQ